VRPATFAPATLILIVVLSVFGAVVGVQLIVQLGVTPNTSIIGALVAMILARVPLALFARYRSIHVQNLAQSVRMGPQGEDGARFPASTCSMEQALGMGLAHETSGAERG
jgi:uncharacterized oligopeptide transporter (OPT) family protein